MAKITLKIRANNGYDGEITNKTTNALINNVSKPLTEPTTPNNGVNGKSLALGYLSLSDGFLGGKNTSLQSEVHKYNGYMFGATDYMGKFDLEFQLTGENIKSIIVRFDKVANQYATVAVLDNYTTIYNSNYVWNIVFNQPSTTHTIKFTDWNRKNYNACVIGIDILADYISYNKNYIDNLSSMAQSTSDGRELTYGVTANTGSADLLDRNNNIRDFIEQGIIPSSNLGIELFVNDKQIQAHIATDSDYDNVGQTFTIQFTNDISQWDKITYSGRPIKYDESDNVISATAWELLVEVMGDLGYTESDIQAMCEDGVENILKGLEIPYPYLDSDTYRATIDKICTLAQLNIYASEMNSPIIVNARPIIASTDRGFLIPTAYQITTLREDVILRNQYDGVDIEKSTPTVNIDQRALVFTDKSTPTDYLTNTNNQSENELSQYIFTPEIHRYAAAYINSYYTNIDITIPKKSSNGLEKYFDLLSGIDDQNNANIRYYVDYTKTMGDVNYSSDDYRSITFTQPPAIDELTLTPTSSNIVGSGTIPTKYTAKYGNNVQDPVATVTIQDLTNNKTAEFDDNDENYHLSLTILCGGLFIEISGTGRNDRNTLSLSGTYEEYIPESITVSIYGNKQTISFPKSVASTPDITSARTVAKIQSNELMQTDSIVNNIKNNILADYANGIKTASIDIFFGDFKNGMGESLDFENGEIVKPYDIIGLVGDNDRYGEQRFWRIIGREFKYQGQPTATLQLQQGLSWHTLFDGEMNIYIDHRGNRIVEGDISEVILKSVNVPTRVWGTVTFTNNFSAPYTNERYFNGYLPFTVVGVASAEMSYPAYLRLSLNGNVIHYKSNMYTVIGNNREEVKNIQITKIEQYY